MKVVVQISAADDAKALALLVRHSPGVALPNRTYVLGPEAVQALSAAGIRYTELSRANGVPGCAESMAGERI